MNEYEFMKCNVNATDDSEVYMMNECTGIFNANDENDSEDDVRNEWECMHNNSNAENDCDVDMMNEHDIRSITMQSIYENDCDVDMMNEHDIRSITMQSIYENDCDVDMMNEHDIRSITMQSISSHQLVKAGYALTAWPGEESMKILKHHRHSVVRFDYWDDQELDMVGCMCNHDNESEIMNMVTFISDSQTVCAFNDLQTRCDDESQMKTSENNCDMVDLTCTCNGLQARCDSVTKISENNCDMVDLKCTCNGLQARCDDEIRMSESDCDTVDLTCTCNGLQARCDNEIKTSEDDCDVTDQMLFPTHTITFLTTGNTHIGIEVLGMLPHENSKLSGKLSQIHGKKVAFDLMCKHHTFTESMRAAAYSPPKYWPCGVAAFTHVRNRRNANVLFTPCEARYDVGVDFGLHTSYMRCLECKCHTYAPRQQCNEFELKIVDVHGILLFRRYYKLEKDFFTRVFVLEGSQFGHFDAMKPALEMGVKNIRYKHFEVKPHDLVGNLPKISENISFPVIEQASWFSGGEFYNEPNNFTNVLEPNSKKEELNQKSTASNAFHALKLLGFEPQIATPGGNNTSAPLSPSLEHDDVMGASSNGSALDVSTHPDETQAVDDEVCVAEVIEGHRIRERPQNEYLVRWQDGSYTFGPRNSLREFGTTKDGPLMQQYQTSGKSKDKNYEKPHYMNLEKYAEQRGDRLEIDEAKAREDSESDSEPREQDLKSDTTERQVTKTGGATSGTSRSKIKAMMAKNVDATSQTPLSFKGTLRLPGQDKLQWAKATDSEVSDLDRKGPSIWTLVNTRPDKHGSVNMSVKTKYEQDKASKQPYAEGMGALHWLVNITRPDVAYAASAVSKHVARHGKEHWEAVDRIIKYLKNTRNHVLRIRKNPRRDGKLVLESLADADWAGEVDGRRSQDGYIIKTNGSTLALAAQSILQKIASLSSMSSEYISACKCAKEIAWARQLMAELGHPQKELTIRRGRTTRQPSSTASAPPTTTAPGTSLHDTTTCRDKFKLAKSSFGRSSRRSRRPTS